MNITGLKQGSWLKPTPCRAKSEFFYLVNIMGKSGNFKIKLLYEPYPSNFSFCKLFSYLQQPTLYFLQLLLYPHFQHVFFYYFLMGLCHCHELSTINKNIRIST